MASKSSNARLKLKDDIVTVEMNKTVWEVSNRYTIQNPIGMGAFGQVVSAVDKKTDSRVAIKKLARPFQTAPQAKMMYRELRMLKHMDHDNVIYLIDCFTPTITLEDFQHVYLVTPLVGADLSQILRTQRLSEDHVQIIVYQILRGLKYIHSAGILHRDLKPSNIALNEDCEVKILDFGMAWHKEEEMTGYVATRWYRAPEIMLNWMHYNQKVDIWSVGCIMAEMLIRKPLFPGSGAIDQLTRILHLVGTPDEDLMSQIKSNDARLFIKSLKPMPKKDFKVVFEGANPLAISLMEKMLDLNSNTRLNATQALAHEYLKHYADPSDELVSENYDHSFEDLDLSIEEWKKLVYKEIESFDPVRVA